MHSALEGKLMSLSYPAAATSETAPHSLSPARSWTYVLICTMAYVFAYIDRQILSLLIQPIKKDLVLSDSEFGLLSGLAFAIFYAAMGIPIASLSDARSRTKIIAAGLLVWSAATVACGLARSFAQLFLARIAVGAGEACISPASYSLIADLFPKDRLGRALAVYSTGSFLGSGLAFFGGGWGVGAGNGPGQPAHSDTFAACSVAARVCHCRPARHLVGAAHSHGHARSVSIGAAAAERDSC